MSKEAKAAAQYNDLKGTIAIDGFDGLAVINFRRGVPAGYHPVGIEIYLEQAKTRDGVKTDSDAFASILAVDVNILDGKLPTGALGKYVREHGQLPVFRFPAKKMNLTDVLPLVKRFSVVLQDQVTGDVPLMVSDYYTQ